MQKTLVKPPSLVVQFFGLIARIGTALVVSTISIIIVMLFLMSGTQPNDPRLGEYFKGFVFSYSQIGWDQWGIPLENIFKKNEWQQYKVFKMGTIVLKIPISLIGIIIQVMLWNYFWITFKYMFFEVHNFWSAFGFYFLSTGLGFVAIQHLALVFNTMPYDTVQTWIRKTLGSREDRIMDFKLVISLFFGLFMIIFFCILQVLYYRHEIWTGAMYLASVINFERTYVRIVLICGVAYLFRNRLLRIVLRIVRFLVWIKRFIWFVSTLLIEGIGELLRNKTKARRRVIRKVQSRTHCVAMPFDLSKTRRSFDHQIRSKLSAQRKKTQQYSALNLRMYPRKFA